MSKNMTIILKKNTRNILGIAFYLFYILGLPLLMTELITRIFFKAEYDNKILQNKISKVPLNTIVQPSNISNLVYELKPGLISLGFLNTKITTDKNGDCRIPEHLANIKNPDLKIAIIGDSSSFGWGVSYNQTYGAELIKMLEQYFQIIIKLRNFSVPGYNSSQHRICFKERVLPWEPDLVILHYDHNDADPVRDTPPNFMAPEFGDNMFNSAFLKIIIRHIHSWKISSVFITKISDGNRNKVYKNYFFHGPQYKFHLNELNKLNHLAKEHSIPILVFIFNTWIDRQSKYDKDPYYYLLYKPLTDTLRSQGYFVLDSYPILQEEMRKHRWKNLSRLWISTYDGHPNADGHKLIARMIFEYINQSEALKSIFKDN